VKQHQRIFRDIITCTRVFILIRKHNQFKTYLIQ